jgi:hypothetical protein
MTHKSIKQIIDNNHTFEPLRRLRYWLHSDDPECAAALPDSGYSAWNDDFAADVCSVLNYVNEIRQSNKVLHEQIEILKMQTEELKILKKELEIIAAHARITSDQFKKIVSSND